MKKLINWASLLLLICVSITSSHAQKREIPQKEFSEILVLTKNNAGKLNYRTVSTVQVKREGESNFEQIQKITSEFAPPNRRDISELTYKNSPRTEVFEAIKIGEIRYERRNSGEWKIEPQKTAVLPSSAKIEPTPPLVKNYYLGEANIGNQTAEIYQREFEIKRESKNTQTGKTEEHLSKRMETYWISREKLTLKMEMEDVFIQPVKSISKRTIIYEYDPKIKIEAPIK